MDNKFYYDNISPDDVDPRLLGVPMAESEDVTTSVVYLDLDTDTVGQALSVLQPVFHALTSGEEPLDPKADTTTMVVIYACEDISNSRLPHVWEYLMRNAKEITQPEVSLLILLIGIPRLLLNVAIVPTIDGSLPKNVSIVMPISVRDHVIQHFSKTEEDLSKINFI